MSVAIVHGGLPGGMKPFDLLDIVAALRVRLGLLPEDIEYLRHAMKRLLRDDFAAGRRCVVWTSAARLAAELGFCARKLNRIETRLAQAGLIARTGLGNGKRYGWRDAQKRIVSAGGIDLGPLVLRAEELQRHQQQHAARTERLLELQKQATNLARDLRGAGEIARQAAGRVFPRMRPSEVSCPDRLAQIVAAWTAILEDLGQTEPTAPSAEPVRPNTEENNITETCSGPQAGSPPAPHRPTAPPPVKTTAAQIWQIAPDPLREGIALYAEAFTPGWCRGRDPGWQAVIMAARDLALQHRVSGADWDRATRVLGAQRAATCVVVALANVEATGRWQVRDVAGTLVGLWRSARGETDLLGRMVAQLVQRSGRAPEGSAR